MIDRTISDKETDSLEVVEIFSSINGEGPLAGQLSTFVRMKGCNLNCIYCDTSWANEKDAAFTAMSSDEICNIVDKEGIINVTLTGGEPLLQKDAALLIEKLCYRHGHHVEIETNGSVDLSPFCELREKNYPLMLAFTMDYKLSCSGMESRMKLSNFALLRCNDTVKFVVGSLDDCQRALDVIREYKLIGKCHLFFSPVFGSIDPADIVSFMNDNKLNGVNLQLQLHKFIWDPDMRGV